MIYWVRNPRWGGLVRCFQWATGWSMVINAGMIWQFKDLRYMLLNVALIALIVPVMAHDLRQISKEGHAWIERAP